MGLDLCLCFSEVVCSEAICFPRVVLGVMMGTWGSCVWRIWEGGLRVGICASVCFFFVGMVVLFGSWVFSIGLPVFCDVREGACCFRSPYCCDGCVYCVIKFCGWSLFRVRVLLLLFRLTCSQGFGFGSIARLRSVACVSVGSDDMWARCRRRVLVEGGELEFPVMSV